MKRPHLLIISFVLLAWVSPARAVVTNVTLSNTTIPAETAPGLINGATIHFDIDVGGNVQIDIARLVNIADPSSGVHVAGISLPGLTAPGPGPGYNFFWNALWLLQGTNNARMNGSYQITVTEAGTVSYVFGTLVDITSVDIHGFTVNPSFDANGEAAFPILIQYALAKNALVTVKVYSSDGTLVRTLVANTPQLGESQKPLNTLSWDGLNESGRPVALDVYTVTVDAHDPGNGDNAIQRSLTVAVLSLANLSTDLQKLFEDNAFVYPNPVRGGQPATIQALAVRNNAMIKVKIYTLAGDLVLERTFSGLSTAETASFTWDATNQGGKKLGRGLYYVVFRQEDPAGTVQVTKKVAIIP